MIEHESVYSPDYRRCVREFVSRDNAPTTEITRTAVEVAPDRWELFVVLPDNGNRRMNNPFSCRHQPLPWVSETSARAYVEHGTMPAELQDVPRNEPHFLERSTRRLGAMQGIAKVLRSLGISTQCEGPDVVDAEGIVVRLPTTHQGPWTDNADRTRRDHIILCWELGEEALPRDTVRVAEQIEAVVRLRRAATAELVAAAETASEAAQAPSGEAPAAPAVPTVPTAPRDPQTDPRPGDYMLVHGRTCRRVADRTLSSVIYVIVPSPGARPTGLPRMMPISRWANAANWGDSHSVTYVAASNV